MTPNRSRLLRPIPCVPRTRENLGIFHYRAGFNGCLYLYQGVSIASRFVAEAFAGMRFNQ